MSSKQNVLLESAKDYVDQGEYDKAISHLLEVISREPTSSPNHIEALVVLGEINWQRGQYDDARETLAKAEQLGMDHGFGLLAARAIRLRGNTMIDQGSGVEAENCYKEALEIFEKVGHKKWIARCLNNLGIIRVERGDFTGALEFYEKSRELHAEAGDDIGVGICLNNIGEIHRFRGEYEEAERLYKQSLRGDEERGDRYGQAICWGNLGAVSFARKDFITAEERVGKAIEIFEHLGTRDLVHVEIRGLMVGILASTKRFDEAQIHLDEIWSVAESLNSDAADIICHFYGGLLSQRQWNLSFARRNFNNCLELARSSNAFEYMLLSRIQLIEIELLHYRITLEEEYLQAMKTNLDLALKLAQEHNLYAPLVELMTLKGFFHIESQEAKKGIEMLEEAKILCDKRGLDTRGAHINQAIDRVLARLEATIESQPESTEEKLKRLQQYIEDCHRVVLASK